MPYRNSIPIQSYQQAKALLDLRRQQGHQRAKLGHNVYLELRPQDEIRPICNCDRPDCPYHTALDYIEVEYIAVKFHDTDIVTYRPDDRIELRCDGWYTATTKANINMFSPFTVYQEKKVWYVNKGPDFTQANIVPFEDGMILDTPA